MMDVDQHDSAKKWQTVSFRCTEDEKLALEALAEKLITTPSRLARFAVCSLLLRRKYQLEDSLRECIYSRNV